MDQVALNIARIYSQGLNPFRFSLSVQLRGQAPGSEGQLDEAAAGGDHDQDGRARKGIHEGQTEGNQRVYDTRKFPYWNGNLCSTANSLITAEKHKKSLPGGGEDSWDFSFYSSSAFSRNMPISFRLDGPKKAKF